MNAKQKREPKEPLRIPFDFETVVADMLTVKPPTDEGNKAKKTISKKAKGKKTEVKDSHDRYAKKQPKKKKAA